MGTIKVTPLGQVGYRFEYKGCVIYIDPYLSNSVEDKEGGGHLRRFPIAIEPIDIDDADWVLITHEHLDHCDPITLSAISKASKNCRFMAPPPAQLMLHTAGVSKNRVSSSAENIATALSRAVSVISVPAAHPAISRDIDGYLSCVGYVLNFDGKLVYHAGDTSVHPELIEKLREFRRLDYGFIPVNEFNYFRMESGIIGNMTVREAFLFAERVNVLTMVPTHWDMFAPNSAEREEIELLYRAYKPHFKLVFYPTSL